MRYLLPLIPFLSACAPQVKAPVWAEPLAPIAQTPSAEYSLLLLALGGLGGWGLRGLVAKMPKRKGPPARLVALDAPVALTLADNKRWELWYWSMRTFVYRAEECEGQTNARGKPRPPMNVASMNQLTGLSARQQQKFKDILLAGFPVTGQKERQPVIHVSASNRVDWLVDKGARRAACRLLQYPTEYKPPKFDLIKKDVWNESGW
jgi:hypothetical protein